MVKPESILCILLAFLCLQPHAGAQTVDPAPRSAEAKPAPDIRSRLEEWKGEVSADLSRLSGYTSPEQLPAGVTETNLNSRRRILDQSLLAINRHLLIFGEISGAKDALTASRAAAADWKGFGEGTPRSVLTVDELINRKESIEEKQASSRSSLDVYETTLAGLLAESRAAEEKVAVALKAYGDGPKDDPAALWKLETARAAQRFVFIRASALEQGNASLKIVLEAGEIDLTLVAKIIREAAAGAVFTEEDLARVKAASEDRQADLRKEISAARKQQGKAISAQAAAAAAFEKLRDSEPPDPAALELAQLNLEAADIRLKSIQSMVDSVESYEQIEAFVPEAYEHRYRLLRPKSVAEREEALAALVALRQRLGAWEIVAKNELASVAADIGKVESRASTFAADDPRLVPINGIRAALWERQALIQRANQSVSGQYRILARWIAEYGEKQKAPWYAPATQALSRARDAVIRIWNVPVNKYEETIEIDGQKVAQTRFVTLGTIVAALLLFISAYLIAARISRRLQRLFVSRSFIGENQARTLRNWIMLVVALLLALATLSWLSIPLTIFAFLAGALAIGVGFGTQTIIKNFISGIILLFERNVRVGDIIEVDGINGVVTEINTRSSIVRGFNGIENLIPNSLFLENRVVNWTLNSLLIRREIKVGVAYGSPAQDVIKALCEVAGRHGLVLKEPPPFAVFSEFAANSLDFTLYFWIELNDRTNGLVVDSDLRIMIEKRLDESGISLHIPPRTAPASTQEEARKPSLP